MYVYSMLAAHAVHKAFGRTPALAGFDLEVESGEIVGLVGHNGAGKSTFARAVAGLIEIDEGEIRIGGRAVTPRRRAGADLGLAPQELALFPTTARENLQYAGRLYGMRGDELNRRIAELAAVLDLEPVLDRHAGELSGGQRRRVHAAAAMLHRPRVLILDEPTVGADPITRELLLRSVRNLADEGCAVIYTTHYLPELDVLDATLAVAQTGRVLVRGTREELLASLPGRAVLRFDRPTRLAVPADLADAAADSSPQETTVTALDAAAVVARLLAANTEYTARLVSIDLSAPTLDDLYRELLMRHEHVR